VSREPLIANVRCLKMKKTQSIKNVKKGDAFAVPLKNGLYVVSRVLHDTTSRSSRHEKKKYGGKESARMLCCNWYGPSPPSVNVPELREVMRRTFGEWGGRPLAGWCSDDVPAEAVYIGTIPPSSDEGKLGVNDTLDWDYLQLQALMQWEWDHDREGMLVREAAKEERIANEYYASEAKRRKELTLDKLAKHRFLEFWEDPIPQVAIRQGRKLLREAAKELASLGQKPTAKARLEVLRKCIKGFNALDAKHEFIGTAEREDICDDFDLLVNACGLKNRSNLADDWREW
jgi:hypothetical protein